jgi:hypothetical protein
MKYFDLIEISTRPIPADLRGWIESETNRPSRFMCAAPWVNQLILFFRGCVNEYARDS